MAIEETIVPIKEDGIFATQGIGYRVQRLGTRCLPIRMHPAKSELESHGPVFRKWEMHIQPPQATGPRHSKAIAKTKIAMHFVSLVQAVLKIGIGKDADTRPG